MKTKEEELSEKNKNRIKYYWQRISDIEKRIEELSNKGVNYSIEIQKRKSLLNNVRRLERKSLEIN